MKYKIIVAICTISILVSSLSKSIPIRADEDNIATVYSEEGYIEYITKDTKATTGITWGNTGFVIRLDWVTSRNSLKDDKYAIIRFTDKGVKRSVEEISGGKKLSTYTLTKAAIENALNKSPYNKTHKKSLLDEFYEMVLNDEPIYLNAIFQVYHGGNAYGPEIFTYNGGYDSKGKYLKGIYSAEPWRDPSTFWQYFNIKVPYHPGVEPVSVEYRTQYNELLYTKNMAEQKIGTDVKADTFPKTYQKNGYTYELYRSYYVNLSKPNVKKEDIKLDKQGSNLSEVRKKQATVKSGGLKFVAMYKVKPDEIEEIPADEKEVEFEEPEPTAVIKADERGNEQFNVEDGIPSSEKLYVNVFATDYLISYRFMKKVGIKKVPVNVEKTYTLKWDKEVQGKDPITGKDKVTYEPQSETKTKSEIVYLERAYGYWVIDRLDVFSLTSAEVKNGALPDNSITIHARDVKLPDIIYQVDKELDKHVFLPKNLKDKYVLPAAEIIGTTSKPSVPEEDLSVYVNSEVGELIVKNDKLIYNGKIIMDGKEIEKEGQSPNDLDKGKTTGQDVLYKHGLTIPFNEPNDIYDSEGTVKYTSAIHIGKANDVKELIYDIADINSVTVHTPTICDAKISDLKAYNQKVNPDTTRASLILDKSFQIQLPTTGQHNDYLGYGYRDYSKYIETREVKFPFDVYTQNKYVAADTWITINADDTTYYLPTWVNEGQYTIEFRAPAINSANSDNSEMYANYSISNYVAVDTIDVDVSGRLYGLTIYDITDYPTWQPVFRNKDSLTLTGTNYTVGVNNQNGLSNGRLAKYTFPLVNGSHPTYENIGAVKLGYSTRFKLTTIGNMYGDKGYISLVPRFYYVDAKGKNRREVDLYYTETFAKKRNYLIRVGSEKDKLNPKKYTLGSVYWQVPETELEATAHVNNVSMKSIRAQTANMFYFGKIKLSTTFRTYVGSGKYTPTGTIPNVVDSKAVTQSVQNWYGEYYLPSDVHVLPKNYDLNKYIQDHGSLDFTEDIWLKHGYIIVNFDIISYQEGEEEGHLSYINKENARKGFCNMWNMEGAQLVKEDYKGNIFEFKYGDYLMYYTDKSAAQDYKSGGTH